MGTCHPGSNGEGGFTLTTKPWQLPPETTAGHPSLDTQDFRLPVKLMKIDCSSRHPGYHRSSSVPLFAAIGMVDRCRPILPQCSWDRNIVLHALFSPMQICIHCGPTKSMAQSRSIADWPADLEVVHDRLRI